MKKKYDFWMIVSYYFLNILNTYFLTSKVLNRYIVTFKHTFTSELFSFLGNFVVLTFILLIGIIILRRPKRILIYLIVVTGLLNLGIIVLGYYTKSYKLAFSAFNFSIFRNPTGGFAANVFFDWIYELFGYFRIVSFLPFVVMLSIFLVHKKEIDNEKIEISWQKLMHISTILVVLQIASYQNFTTSLKKNWRYSSDYAQYGCQYTGVYNYYLSEFIFRIDNRTLIDDKLSTEDTYLKLADYNKNQESYVNFIDGKTYSNKDKQTGILKDYNVFTIQMESTMAFCFENTYKGLEITPNFNNLFKDDNCFYFNNVFTNVGIGNTSDAEFCYFTGLYPTGDMTIVWEFNDYDFQMKTLGDYMNKDYVMYSYNPTTEVFYNHKNVHERLYKVNKYRGLETYEQLYPRRENADKYLNYWIKDNSILNWANQYFLEVTHNGERCHTFLETITPHNPFPDFSSELGFEHYNFNLGALNYQLDNYLNQIHFNDKLLYDFIMETSDTNSSKYMENTVYILYGDHGNALPKDCYDKLYGRELTDFEYRRILLNIPVIVYDPSGKIYESLQGEDITSILSSVKAERDLNRTLRNLLGIESSDYQFGVNIFSGEPSYSYDPKNFDIITDNFMYSKKKDEYVVYKNAFNMNIVEKIEDYRSKQDLYLNTLVYSSKKRTNKISKGSLAENF